MLQYKYNQQRSKSKKRKPSSSENSESSSVDDSSESERHRKKHPMPQQKAMYKTQGAGGFGAKGKDMFEQEREMMADAKRRKERQLAREYQEQ